MNASLGTLLLGSLLICPAARACLDGDDAVPSAALQPAATSAPAPQTRPAEASAPPARGGRLELPDRPGAITSDLFYRTLAYTLVILVLGGLALFLVKRVLPKVAAHAGKRVSVLETVYLGPRKTLHLLQVGSRRFLVAAGREQVRMLAEVTSAFAEPDDPPSAPQSGPDRAPAFAAVLRGRDEAGEEGDGSP